MNIRRAKKKDLKNVSKLISRTFDNPARFENNILKGKLAFLAEEKNKIIGFIEADPDRIRIFCVDKKHQGKGIGKSLMKKLESLTKDIIYVSASIPAVPIYLNLGFKKTTGKRKKNGRQYQPMKKILTKQV